MHCVQACLIWLAKVMPTARVAKVRSVTTRVPPIFVSHGQVALKVGGRVEQSVSE